MGKHKKKGGAIASIVLTVISIVLSGFSAVVGCKAYKLYLKDHKSE